MTSGFHVEIDGGIAVVTIDRPKANAIDSTTSRALGEAFVGFERDDTVRVAIITGAGERFFCAGWDLGAAAEGESFDVDNGAGGFGGFPDLPDRRTPVIAAVNGMAVGGGFEIAMAADLVVAADHAQFFLPEARLGILPDAASVRLPRLVPPHIARELLLTGRRMDATEAARWGIVNKVVPAADLMATATTLAAEVIAAAPLSVAAILDIGRRTATTDPIEAIAAIRHLASYRAAIDSQDAVEGTTAFEEKRPPVWRGR
ncbi:MAG: enoyl-CoA hydratase-related protein [Ilumatobacteraceae bacterium]